MAKAPKPTPVPETDQGAAAIVAAAPAEVSEVVAPSDPIVQEEVAASSALKIRVRTGRFPYRRAGHVFSGAGAWDELELEGNPKNAAALIAWIEDPAIKVQAFNGEEWEDVSEVPTSLVEMAALEGEPSE